MRTALIVFVALASLLCADDKKRKSKDLKVEIVELVVRRSEGTISIDGRVRNTCERAIPKLTLLFHLYAPGKVPVTTQRGAIEEEVLEPGEDSEFRWMMRDPVRAVRVQVDAVDGNGNELIVAKAGPYPIE